MFLPDHIKTFESLTHPSGSIRYCHPSLHFKPDWHDFCSFAPLSILCLVLSFATIPPVALQLGISFDEIRIKLSGNPIVGHREEGRRGIKSGYKVCINLMP